MPLKPTNVTGFEAPILEFHTSTQLVMGLYTFCARHAWLHVVGWKKKGEASNGTITMLDESSSMGQSMFPLGVWAEAVEAGGSKAEA